MFGRLLKPPELTEVGGPQPSMILPAGNAVHGGGSAGPFSAGWILVL
jgi:hypothetical protein